MPTLILERPGRNAHRQGYLNGALRLGGVAYGAWGSDGARMSRNTSANVVKDRPRVHPLYSARAPSPSTAMTPRARSHTRSNIPSVSLPVNVFCWLGW